MKIHITGALSALYAGCAYIFGFAVMLLLLSPDQAAEWTQEERLVFLLEHQLLLNVWNTVIYTLFGIVLIFLTLTLHSAVNQPESVLAQSAKVLGFIWAGLLIASGMVANVGMDKVSSFYRTNTDAAILLWQTISVVQDGLGGGVEVIGGLWVILYGKAGLKVRSFPVPFAYFSFIVGGAGCISIIPGLSDAGVLFGLGQIVWFLWLSAILFLRAKHPTHSA